MKYSVLGPRLLLKVQKFGKEQTFKDSAIIMTSSTSAQETISQTRGEVVEIGSTLNQEYEGFEALKVGDRIAFQRYGAVRVGVDEEEVEHWVINGRDALCIITE